MKLRNVFKGGSRSVIKKYLLIYFIIISTFFIWMNKKTTCPALCESDIIPIFAKQRRFVYTRTKRRILLLVAWQLNHPVTKATGYSGRVISSLGRENEGFLTHFTHRGFNEIAMSPLFRGPSRPGATLHAKRKCATDCSIAHLQRNYIVTPRDIAPYFLLINHC